MVSIPQSFWVRLARSKLRFLVVLLAPHVMLIASGFSAERRDIRERMFSKPCKIELVLDRLQYMRQCNLFCTRT